MTGPPRIHLNGSPTTQNDTSITESGHRGLVRRQKKISLTEEITPITTMKIRSATGGSLRP